MSFFSGFMLGQAMSNKGNSGGAVLGFFGLFAIAAVVGAVAFTLGAFLLPLYGIAHLTFWAIEVEALAGLGVFLVPVVLLPSVPLAYVYGLFGTKETTIWGIGTLGIVTILTVLSMPHFKGSLLHEYKELGDPELIAQNAIVAFALCTGCATAIRFAVAKFMSFERRERIIYKVTKPYLAIYNSRPLAWCLCVMALLGLALCFLIFWQDQQRIFEFMSTTGRTYDQGFAFVYYGDKFTEDMAVLGLMIVLAAITSAHIVLQSKRNSKRVAAE